MIVLAVERAALAGGEDERELVARPARAGRSASAAQLVEQLGDLERDPAVGVCDVAPRVVVVVDGERDPRAAVRASRRRAPRRRRGRRGARRRGRSSRSGGRGPRARRRRRLRRAASGRASRRGRRARARRSAGRRRRPRRTRRRTRRGPPRRPRAAARARRRRATPSARISRAWISGSGSVPGERLEQRRAQVEGVVRELEVEERRLPLLELARGGQHVVGVARGLGHRDVDHDDELERRQRLAEALRSRRASAPGSTLSIEHRAEALRVVGEDLLGDRRCTARGRR